MKTKQLLFLGAITLVACEKTTKVRLEALSPSIVPAPASACPTGGYLINNSPICNGADGISIGVNTFPSVTCASGGTLIEFFKDSNNNGTKESTEPLVSVTNVCNGNDAVLNLGVATTSQCLNGGITVNGVPVCNGLNGLNGQDGQDATLVFGTPTVAQCPNGGVTVNGHPICNGLNGVSPTLSILPYSGSACPVGGITVNGVPVCHGEPGPMGPSGSGAGIIAAKLCPADNHPLAEYGFIVGDELYAVLYGNQSSHPHHIGLVRVSPGTYVTTATGTPKTFTYTKSGSTITLTCDSVTSTYDLSGGGSGSGGVSCLVQKTHDWGTERHYSTTVTGTGIAGDYKIVYQMSNNSFNSASSCTGMGFWTDNTCSVSQYSTSSAHNVHFTPIGSSMNYTVYVKGNSSLIIQTATLVKISTNETKACTVINSTP